MSEQLFDELITNGTGRVPYFVMFQRESCPACHQSLPIFEMVEDQCGSSVEFYTIDTVANENLAQRYQIFALPTFGLFFRGNAIPFAGPRTVPGFTKFLVEEINYQMLPVNETWASSDNKMVVLFAKRKLPPSYLTSAFARYYRYEIDFGMTGNASVISEFGDIKIPSWYFSDGKNKKVFDDINSQNELFQHIEEFFGIQVPTKTPMPEYNEL